jgi:Ti type entry exclusion protein TrbK
MVRTKLILTLLIGTIALGVAIIWLFLPEHRAATEQRRSDFFATPRQFPTSGGQKMRPEW